MGQFLDELRASRSEPAAIHQRFRLEYDERSDNIYAFFESLDDWQFYRAPIISRAQAARINVYLCGNKDGVWSAYTFAERRSTLKNVVCFVDKDLDDFCAEALPVKDRIYVTQCYSIENHLCTRSAIDIFLNVVVGLPDTHPTREAILKEFEESLSEFQGILLPVFAWAIASRCKGMKIVFDNVGPDLSSCLEYEGFRIKEKQDICEFFRGRCRGGRSESSDEDSLVNDSEVTQWKDALRSRDPKTWVRGKYELWFTLRFMNRVWAELRGQLVTDRRKVKTTLNLSPDNIFITLGDKLSPPAGLAEFLRKNIAA